MRLAVMGAGAVGRAVCELAGEYGHSVVAVADSTSAQLDSDGLDVDSLLSEKEETGHVGDADHDDALAADYDVLVEATPTTLGDAEPGVSHAETALAADRHVVLANKGPVATRYDDLVAAADASAGSVRFEATVGGAIPVLATIEDQGPSRVRGIRGILNGTANFILSRMVAEGLGYEHVLAEAQDLGVAETDPSFDVDGIDAALKGVILANVLAGEQVTTLDRASVAGIRDVPPHALELATDEGLAVRLVVAADRDGVSVAPRLVDAGGPLAVWGTTNVVELDTAHADELTLSGPGAGGEATASAVMADVGRLPAP